ncbi:LPS export ABC transporter periplasmic protein LptC [Variovorax brevis]|uniref:LPS export ABC transporter periplasmic protein LptC n=1 Tax=Variovorax brevis TaxID=3053503 RepID=UPI00403808B2
MLTWLRVGIDRITIYLPVILTACLALGTYWLVRNAPKFSEPGAPPVVTHDPDYFMRGFVVKRFMPNGELRSELWGKEGRHYPDNDTLEVDDVKVRSVSPNGLTTRSTANRGLSNADGSEVQLFGNAIVVRDAATDRSGKAVPRLEFRGEFLHAFTDTERVSSNKPVTLTRDKDQFTADSLEYDNLTGVAVLTGRVRGVIAPPSAAAAAPARPAPAKKKR